MSNPNDYTVGWICAIPTEYVAAQAFLDEKHEGPDYVSPNDNNDYTLGKIGRHNIVIAVLPDGEYGLSSAASVARDMLHSFPHVRIGLMVGIGGGAPSSKHDIRLGDVVVGVSNNGKGGVVQYDFGKAIQGQEFQETAFLNQPPTLLRTAVGGMMAQYESDGIQISETVNSALAKKPRLRKKYKRPEAITDRLYRSQVVHPLNSETGCAVVCGDDPSSLIERRERDEDDDDPMIHYGLIASANTLLKDASVRDELIAKKGVLCFEMEAAGLMNHFPCLVIRGICDYSDSHKNKEWQGYASMTAAAYAKDLLLRIVPNRVEAEKKISDILSGLCEVAQEHRDIAEDHRDIAKDHRNVAKEQLRSQKDLDKERQLKEERECHQLFRLTAGGKDTTYEWYKDRVEERVKDTCNWFLKHEHFQKWLERESGPLLVTADPGCGKSVLAKYLIDHGLPRSATICYFFFKDQDQNTSCQALCALLHQLFAKKPPLIKHAMQQFREDGQGLINSTNSLWKILYNATKDPQAGPIIIVLNALDECAESEFAGLMRNVESQFHDDQSDCAALKYLLTCRPYSQIVSKFHNLVRAFPNIRIPGEEESETIAQEVNRVISYRVNQLSDDISPQIKNYLEQRLQKTTHRTYLWLYLMFDYLEKEVFKKTLKGVESAVAALPKSVNEAYEQILNKSEDKLIVRKALSIILAASRPLILSEMNIAMNIVDTAQDGTTQTFHDLDLEDESDFKLRLRSWCGLFISIYHGKVYFLHQTAREFLLADLASPTAIPSALHWENSITIRQAHNILAELCVLYLNLFHSTMSLTIAADSKTSYLTNSNAFLDYSSENWGVHFREAHIVDGAAIIPATLKVCDPGSKSFSIWFKIYQRSKPHSPTGNLTNLIIASYYGHCTLAQLLLERGADIEAKDRSGWTPLLWATAQGHEAVAQLLLKKGADIEAKDQYSRTPLSWATAQGQEAIAQLLLEKGADIEAKDRSGRTPLLWAAVEGQEAVAQLLLEKGADIEAKEEGSGRTPLLWAAEGQEAVAQLLLERGADIEVKDEGYGWTPLSWAAVQGQEAIAQLLLEKGADIEAKDRSSRTPLLLAAAKGQEAVAQLLLKKGADIEAKDQYSRTPLSWAAVEGHEAIAQLLLKRGADIEVKEEGSGRTPLLWAAVQGQEAIAQLLLEKGADIEAKDRSGRTPLLWAAAEGQEAVAQLLLKKGADIEAKDQYSRTPLLWAAVEGHEAIAQLLLEKGADIEAKEEGSGRTPLLWAAEGQEAIAQLLLKRGADIEAKEEGSGRTPLLSAAAEGQEAVAQLLLKRGADIEVKEEGSGRTPLLWAAAQGQEAVAQLLLEKGADIEAKEEGSGRTPLLWAAAEGQEAVAQLLLKKGANIEAKEEGSGRTPLLSAAAEGQEAVAQLLLKKGADIEAKEEGSGRTPLLLAAAEGQEAVAQLLLKKGANIEAKEEEGSGRRDTAYY